MVLVSWKSQMVTTASDWHAPTAGSSIMRIRKSSSALLLGMRGKILLCRRDIEPRRGYWTIPAGYLELNETVVDGAWREVREEALAKIKIDLFLGIYNVPRVSQVQIIFRATLLGGAFGAGEETLEAELFAWEDIPRDKIAFPSVNWALDHYRAVEGKSDFAPHSNPVGDLGNFKS